MEPLALLHSLCICAVGEWQFFLFNNLFPAPATMCCSLLVG